jgi:hypothetical protein
MKITHFTSALSITVLMFALGSCSPTMKVKNIDKGSDQLPTDTNLKNQEILVRKNIRLSDYKQFLFVRTGSPGQTMGRYDHYVLGTLKNIGFFDHVYSETDMQKLIIQKGIVDQVNGSLDNIGMYNLQKEIGKFLIAQTFCEQVSKYTFEYHLEIIDPSSGETIYYIKHKGTNWSGLDRPLFNPVFNDFIVWVNQNS